MENDASKMHGNAAALRAALAPWISLAEWLIANAGKDALGNGIAQMAPTIRKHIDESKAALAAPARPCDLINDPVDVMKEKWDAQFYKRSAPFSPLTRVIARQAAHAAIEAWFEPITDLDAYLEGEDE